MGEGKGSPRKSRVVIYGAGSAGALVVEGLSRAKDAAAQPVAFVDDDPSKVGRRVAGLPVCSSKGSIRAILKKYKADRVLIAMPSAPGRRIREIHLKLLAEGLPAWIVPGISEIVDSDDPITTFRTVNPEDFLRRHPRVLGRGKIEPYYRRERVLVTGAGGTIGSELFRQLHAAGVDHLAGVDHSELAVYALTESFSNGARSRPEIILADMSKPADVRRVFDRFRPTVVFHAAAYKHVTILESRPEAAIQNNIGSTRLLVDAAVESGVHTFVHISTDKAVRPKSLMGATKRAGELIVRSAAARSSGKKFVSVRFGNVLGSSGSVLPKFIEQISRGGPVTVSDPGALRYFMLTGEAVELVQLCGAAGVTGKIYLLDIGEPINISELAADLIRFFGKRPGRDIRIAYTGLAPGEKLVENLYDAPNRPTSEPYLLEVIDSQKISRLIDRWSDALLRAAAESDAAEVHRFLNLLVPEYRPGLSIRNLSARSILSRT